MKVIKGDKNLPDGFALCPVCRDWVGNTFNYCTKCGQRLVFGNGGKDDKENSVFNK